MALISPVMDNLLVRVLQALNAYRQDVVLIGGAANSLYRYHGHASRTVGVPMVTLDLDLAVPNRLPAKGELLTAALARNGLVPCPEYQRTNKYGFATGTNEVLELLCPATGIRKTIRQGSPALVDIQPGCVAEALEYMRILLEMPWSVNLRHVPALDLVEADLEVQIPNPVSYVTQKVLIRKHRSSISKRAKDCYYVYETAVVFREALPILADQALRLRPLIHPRWRQDYLKQADVLFGHQHAEGVQDVFAVARENGVMVTTNAIWRVVKPFLHALESGFFPDGESLTRSDTPPP